MPRRNLWIGPIAALLLVLPAGTAGAGVFDWGGSACGTEDVAVLEAYRAGDLGPLVPPAGPPSSDHSRSLNIFRSRFHGLVPAEELNGYLTQKLQDMLAKGLNTTTPPPLAVYVTTSGDFNAAAAPDGAIYIPMATLQQIKNEDELAFLLGHEASHILLAHHQSDWFVKTQYYAYLSWVALDQVLQKLNDLQPLTSTIAPEWSTEMHIMKLVYTASEKVVHPLWKQEQESCADLLGYELMKAARHSPAAATTFLTKLVSLEEALELAKKNKKQAEDLANKVGQADADGHEGQQGSGQTQSEAFSPLDIFTKIEDLFIDTTVEVIKEVDDHPSASDRLAAVIAYQTAIDARSKAPARPTKIRKLPWKAKEARFATLLANYETAYEALRKSAAAGEENKNEAAKLALRSLKDPTKQHVLPWFAFAQARRAQNRPKDYIENLEIGLKRSAEPSLWAYTELIEHRLSHGQPAQALAIVETEVVPRFAETPPTLPLRIRVLMANGRKEQAHGLVPLCLEYDFKELHEHCKAEAGITDPDSLGIPMEASSGSEAQTDSSDSEPTKSSLELRSPSK